MLKTIPLLAFVVFTSSCATIEKNITPATSNQITKSSISSKDGLITVKSNYSVKETADRFESIANSKGLTLFTRIDHQKNAAGVNLTLRPTEVIIFGNPKAGTVLMQCDQNVAIDLPQKVLISEDATGAVHLS